MNSWSEQVEDLHSRTGELSADGRTALWTTAYAHNRDGYLRKTWGLRYDQWFAIMIEQGEACYGCRKPWKRQKGADPWRGTRIVVDHDHETFEIYGLMHNYCNRRRLVVPADPPARRVGPFFVPETRRVVRDRMKEAGKERVKEKRRHGQDSTRAEPGTVDSGERKLTYQEKIDRVRRRRDGGT